MSVIPTVKAFENIVKEFDALNKDATKLSISEIPIKVKAEIRHLVQVQGHEKDSYKASSLSLLTMSIQAYPVLLPVIVNNIFDVYAKAKSLRQKQAKLTCIFSVIRARPGCFPDLKMLLRLVAEVMMVRNPADKDDNEILVLVTALSTDAFVPAVTELILEGMGTELQHPIKELKLTGLWLRVVMVVRLTCLGHSMPNWLRDTMLPDRVAQFAEVIIPRSQKLEETHYIFSNFIEQLSLYHQKKYGRKVVKEGQRPKMSPVAVLFSGAIGDAIIKSYGEKRKKQTLQVAYKWLERILWCSVVDLSVLESVVRWLADGHRCLTPAMRKVVVDGLLSQLRNLEKLPTDEDKSRLAVCVLEGSMVMPEVLQHVRDHLHHLTSAAAQDCVDNMIRVPWRKLTEVAASLLLRLVSLSQCCGKDNLAWRLRLTKALTKRAVDELDARGQEEEKGDAENNNEEAEDNDKEGRSAGHKGKREDDDTVPNHELFVRFLNHASTDKHTVAEVIVEAHNVAWEMSQSKTDFFHDEEKQDAWNQLAEKSKMLQESCHDNFPYKKTFQMLIGQFALELMLKPTDDTVELITDVLTCLDRAILECESGAAVDSDSDWCDVLVGVLLALCTRVDSWWRCVLKVAGKQLGNRLTMDSLNTVMEVLLRDDAMGDLEDEEVEDMDVDGDGDDDISDEDELEENINENERSLDGDEKDDSDSAEEEEEEDDGDEDSNDDDKDDDDDDDSSEDEEDSDDSDEEGGDSDEEEETRLDAMKSALRAAMMPIQSSADADEEDMDAVPAEELARLNKRLGMVLKEYIKKPSSSRKRAKTLKGDGAELLQYRTRVMDLLEGDVEGLTSPTVLIRGLLLPLLQALSKHNNKLMKPLVNRICSVLKSVCRIKKFEDPLSVSADQLIHSLEEVFVFADKIAESYYAVVPIVRCAVQQGRLASSDSSPDSGGDRVIQAYFDHIRTMIRTRKINKLVILEPLNVDMPELRSQMLQLLVDETFLAGHSGSSTATSTEPTSTNTDSTSTNTDSTSTNTDSTSTNTDPTSTNTDPTSTDSEPTSTNTEDTSSHTSQPRQVFSGRSRQLWELLQDVLVKVLAATSTQQPLSEQDKQAVSSISRHIQQYLEQVESPSKKELEPVSLILKRIKKHPVAHPSVDWASVSGAVQQFRARVAKHLSNNKNLKRDVDRLATIAAIPGLGASSEVQQEKQGLKRKRKEAREQKLSVKKMKREEAVKLAHAKKEARKKATAAGEGPDLFGSDDGGIDEDDPDSDEDDDDEGTDDETRMQKLKAAEAMRQKKAMRNRAKKLRAKTNKQLKKEIATRRKMDGGKTQASISNGHDVSNSDASKENAVPRENGAGGCGSINGGSGTTNGTSSTKEHLSKPPKQHQRKPSKKIFKLNRREADEKLSADLKTGVFAS